MSTEQSEYLFAKLLTDSELRSRFLVNPISVLDQFDLSDSERSSFLRLDVVGLKMASHSFAMKRSKSKDGGRRDILFKSWFRRRKVSFL